MGLGKKEGNGVFEWGVIPRCTLWTLFKRMLPYQVKYFKTKNESSFQTNFQTLCNFYWGKCCQISQYWKPTEMFQISQFIKRMTVFFFGFHLTHKVPVMKIKSFVCVVVCVTHSEPLSLMVIIQELPKTIELSLSMKSLLYT